MFISVIPFPKANPWVTQCAHAGDGSSCVAALFTHGNLHIDYASGKGDLFPRWGDNVIEWREDSSFKNTVLIDIFHKNIGMGLFIKKIFYLLVGVRFLTIDYVMNYQVISSGSSLFWDYSLSDDEYIFFSWPKLSAKRWELALWGFQKN